MRGHGRFFGIWLATLAAGWFAITRLAELIDSRPVSLLLWAIGCVYWAWIGFEYLVHRLRSQILQELESSRTAGGSVGLN